MALNNSEKEAIAKRREKVSELRAEYKTLRQIADVLGVSHVTIASDCKFNLREWHKRAEAKTGEHIARQLSEIEEAKRLARKDKNPDAIIRALALEVKLLGTASPDKVEISEKTVDDAINAELAKLARRKQTQDAGAVEGADHSGLTFDTPDAD